MGVIGECHSDRATEGSTRNLQFIFRSIDEPEVPTGDPHVASLLRMTELKSINPPNPVIPTEEPVGFDEESSVGTSQSSKTRITNWRSSRHSLSLTPQDDWFSGFSFSTNVIPNGSR